MLRCVFIIICIHPAEGVGEFPINLTPGRTWEGVPSPQQPDLGEGVKWGDWFPTNLTSGRGRAGVPSNLIG